MLLLTRPAAAIPRATCAVRLAATRRAMCSRRAAPHINRTTFNHRQANVGGAVVAAGVVLGIGGALLLGAPSEPRPAITDDFGNAQANLHPTEFRHVQLEKHKRLTADTALLRFKLPPSASLGGDVPASVQMRALATDVDECQPFGRHVERSYSVVSLPGNTGHFDIIVKRYPSPEGDMSRFLHGLVPGDSVQVRGPVVALGNNHASRDGDSDGDSGGDGAAALGSSGVNAAAAWHAKRKVGMLAGGTGVTPMIQLVRYALERNQDAPTADTTAAPRAKDDDDDDEATATLAARTSSDGETAVAAGTIGQFPWQRKSQLSLVVSDQAATDAIFKKELAKISKQNKDVVSVYRTLTRHAPKGWNQGRGRMSKVMLRHLLPPPGPDTIIFVAGPRGFVEHVAGPSEVVVPAEQRRMSWGRDKARGKKRPVGGLLGELGYTSEMVQVL